MNKVLTILIVLALVVGVGFFVMRGMQQADQADQTDQADLTDQTDQTDQADQTDQTDLTNETNQTKIVFQPPLRESYMLKMSIRSNRVARSSSDKPTVNLGLQAARPKWLAATEKAMDTTRAEMVVEAKKISEVEDKLRQNDESVAAKHAAMKADYGKYRSAVEATDLYRAAKAKEQESALRSEEISLKIAAAQSGTNGVSVGVAPLGMSRRSNAKTEDRRGLGIDEMQAELAKVCDELVKASINISEVEGDIRAVDQSVARAYAAMVRSRRIYRDSLKSDEAYMIAKGAAEEVTAHYQDLVERREKLKKEIGNE